MSEAVLGWPNGSLGMMFGTVAGLLVIFQAWRTSAWDIHDERSYSEPQKFSFGAAVPSAVMLATLLTLLLGIGSIDRDIPSYYGQIGDALGLIELPVAAAHVVRSGRGSLSETPSGPPVIEYHGPMSQGTPSTGKEQG